MTKTVTKGKGEIYTHRLIWFTAQHQIKLANSIEEGSKYCYLCAMVMLYFTFESYLNFLGEIITPKIWKDERKHFSSKEYPGTEGKLIKILEWLNLPMFEKGKRPYQSIHLLLELRNRIAHGKQVKFNFSVRHLDDQVPYMMTSYFNRTVSKENTLKASEDVEQILKFLHEKVRTKTGDPRVGASALQGILGSAIGGKEET